MWTNLCTPLQCVKVCARHWNVNKFVHAITICFAAQTHCAQNLSHVSQLPTNCPFIWRPCAFLHCLFFSLNVCFFLCFYVLIYKLVVFVCLILLSFTIWGFHVFFGSFVWLKSWFSSLVKAISIMWSTAMILVQFVWQIWGILFCLFACCSQILCCICSKLKTMISWSYQGNYLRWSTFSCRQTSRL